jgi:hypothetical protein
MRNNFDEAMHFRHACKLFDTTKSIIPDDLEFILNSGRLSPSSFGVEHWHFFLVRNPEMRESIRQASWGQQQVTTASELIVIAYKKSVRSTDAYIQSEFDKFSYPDGFRSMYKEWIDPRSDDVLEAWSAKQVYIAAGNMMTAAASIGIDSCPIEGFDSATVEKIMGIDTSKYAIAMLLPFGYRVNEQPALHRSELSELVTYLN